MLGELSYFRPYDRFTEDALSKLPVEHRHQAEPALPSGSEIAFENATFKVWALPKLLPFGISLGETTTSTGLAKLAPHRQKIGLCSRSDC
ncbi:hypothetical protein [Kaistia terrae]|nr:hypothetical protein [Kaistia terrae]MCX5578949.1 hypothetical protein [Kaistia terrae]